MGRTRTTTRTKSPVLKFGEPPPTRRDYQWEAVAEGLRKRPGEWAVVHQDLPSSVVWAVNAGRVSPVHPSKGFRTRTEGNTQPESGPRMCATLWMVYDAALDQSKSKSKSTRNGRKR